MNNRSTFLILLALTIHTPAAYGQSDELLLDSLRRDTPSARYMDPASFFRIHGYATIGYRADGAHKGEHEEGVTHGVNPRTGTKLSGFQNDAALFVSGVPFDGVTTALEVHFMGNRRNPMLTEAKFSYQLANAGTNELVLTGGRFWWPFGIHNGEWFAGVDKFPVMSVAGAEILPAHYNEVGFMLEGASALSGSWGINYVGAIGNGVPSFDFMDMAGSGADLDAERTVTGRLALAHVGTLGLEIGMSGASGGLRDDLDPSQPVDNANRYGAGFTAFGPDLTLTWSQLALSAYWYHSYEELAEAPRPELARDGFTIESSYRLPVADNDRLSAVGLHARVSWAEEDNVVGDVYRRRQYSGAMSFELTRAFGVQVGYVLQQDRAALDLPLLWNQVLGLSFTAKF